MSTEGSPRGTAEPSWHKSSHSGGEGGECVEFAATHDAAHVRDSKAAQGPRLTFAPGAWTGFLTHTGR